jgi:transposase
VRLVTKPVGKPDAGKLHVRFDERGEETERATSASPRLSSTLLKRQKNDSTDAEAICEAVTRPNMRFVPTKTVEQQSCLMLHRARHLFIRQQTAVINSIRAYLAEFGIVAPVGRRGVEQLLEVVADTADPARVLRLSAANCGP